MNETKNIGGSLKMVGEKSYLALAEGLLSMAVLSDCPSKLESIKTTSSEKRMYDCAGETTGIGDPDQGIAPGAAFNSLK